MICLKNYFYSFFAERIIVDIPRISFNVAYILFL